MRRLLPITLLLIAITWSQAAARDVAGQLLRQALPQYGAQRRAMQASPATWAHVDSISLSWAETRYTGIDSGDSGLPQEGTGRRELTVAAGSYQRLDSAQTVWGDASFTTGRIDQVRLSNCVDYRLLAPYVLGDDTGGDLDLRRYTFAGGYARATGRLTLAASVDYRAEMAWRDIDPRVKTIVSDLQGRLGLAYETGRDRFAAIDLSIRCYSQNCDLDFYNPLNDINTLPYTGLGTYNKRFAGNSNKNSGHSGLGYSLGASWASADAMGLQASVSFSAMRVEQQLRNFNNITLAYTHTYHTSASAAWGLGLGRAMLFPTVECGYLRRLGSENIFGTASGAAYDRIGSRSPYLHTLWYAGFSLPSQIKAGAGYICLQPSVAWADTDISHSAAARRVVCTTLRYGLTGGYTALQGRWLWSARARYSRMRCSMTATHPLSGAASSPSLGVDIDAGRMVGTVMAGLSAGYAHTHRHGHRLYISMHIKF